MTGLWDSCLGGYFGLRGSLDARLGTTILQLTFTEQNRMVKLDVYFYGIKLGGRERQVKGQEKRKRRRKWKTKRTRKQGIKQESIELCSGLDNTYPTCIRP
jgi:hypothetical protein